MMRILVVDPRPISRLGLKAVLQGYSEPVILGEATGRPEALRLLRQRKWDLLVVDVPPGDEGSLKLVQQVSRRWPAVPVLAVSTHGEEQVGLQAVRAGARGFVTLDCQAERLWRAASTLRDGGRFVTPRLLKLLSELSNGAGVVLPHERLTEREYQVLRLLGQGFSSRVAAQELKISFKTVSTHKVKLLAKMKLKSEADLVRYVSTYQLAR